MAKSLDKWQYGDFQTPSELAEKATRKLAQSHGISPDFVVEPSCGVGAFVLSASKVFVNSKILGVDVNPEYIGTLMSKLSEEGGSESVNAIEGDFFTLDWQSVLPPKNSRLLVLGNPPWVTASELGALNSKNLPEKSNFQNARGIEAITGSSNFDISEWMILRYLDWIQGSPAHSSHIAVLCKTSVARKIFRHASQSGSKYEAHIYPIDAKKYFGAAVDACLFVISQSHDESSCSVYYSMESEEVLYSIGVRGGKMVRDLKAHDRWAHLGGMDATYIWRSGVKHDCSKIMELSVKNNSLENGLGVNVEIEDRYLFPLFKSSDVANGRTASARKYVLIPQRFVGEDTKDIEMLAPKTWDYLVSNAEKLDNRASSVYRGKPRFSVFGVGNYTFGKWKVAISGLYKKLHFELVAPYNGRPSAFDDTVYFVSMESREEAELIYQLLTSSPATKFLESFIFWDEKRPITAKILRSLSIRAVAKELNKEQEFLSFANAIKLKQKGQLELGIAEKKSLYIVESTSPC